METTIIHAFVEIKPDIPTLSTLCKQIIVEHDLDVTKLPTELQNMVIKLWECPIKLQLIRESGLEYWNAAPQDSIIFSIKEGTLLAPFQGHIAQHDSITTLKKAPNDASDEIKRLIASWHQCFEANALSYLTFQEIFDWTGWNSHIQAGTSVQPADLDTVVEELKKQGAEFTSRIMTRTGIYILTWEIPKRRYYSTALDKLNELMKKYSARPENIRIIAISNNKLT